MWLVATVLESPDIEHFQKVLWDSTTLEELEKGKRKFPASSSPQLLFRIQIESLALYY